MLEKIAAILFRMRYRLGQFWRVVNPQYDPKFFAQVRKRVSPAWQTHFDRLRPSEKAHVLRLCRKILDDPSLNPCQREDLLVLAIAHDLGKTVTRPFLIERVFKTLLPLPNLSHARVGAKILENLGAPKRLVFRVAHHHDDEVSDDLLKIFQNFDNSL